MNVWNDRGAASRRSWLPRLRAALLPVAIVCAADRAAADVPVPRPLLAPVTPACVSSPFGPRRLSGRPLAGTFHRGIDLPAPAGAAVHAVAAGTIIRVQRRGVGGLEILVRHPGFVAVYSHLGRVTPAIANGRRSLAAGEIVGVIGRTGVTYGTHLYFGMIVDGRPVDPAGFFAVTECGAAATPQKKMLDSR